MQEREEGGTLVEVRERGLRSGWGFLRKENGAKREVEM